VIAAVVAEGLPLVPADGVDAVAQPARAAAVNVIARRRSN
jgi:hypothetical protein